MTKKQRESGADRPPLVEKFRALRKAHDRAMLVSDSIYKARADESVFQLGLLALTDRSALVRFQACRLLAYSLKRAAVPELKAHKDEEDVDVSSAAIAAIDAIKHQNHNYFYDRDHSGKTNWNPIPRSQM